MPKNVNTKNKRHVAHLEQVRRQTQAIKVASIIVIALVVGLVSYGLFIDPIIQLYRPVVNVNGEWITAGKFRAQATVQRILLINQYNQYLQYGQMFGIADVTNDPNFGPAIQQITSQLEPLTLGQQAIDSVIDDQIIRQEAKKRNIVVSAEEVETELQAGIGYYPKGSPTPTATDFVVAEPTLNATQVAVVSLTPTPGPVTPTITPTLDPSITPTITPTPTATVTAGPSATPPPTLTPLPSATPLTLEGYQENLKKQLEGLKTEAQLSENDFRGYHESVLYRKKVQDVIVADLKPVQEQVWARHILVSTEDEANQVLTRLKAGEDFATLAAQISTDTGSAQKGGDLGWFGHGAMLQEFETAAFGLKVGELSLPIKTTAGVHIIQALGHENRQLNGADFQRYKDQTFADFVKKLRDESKIEIYDLWKQMVPTEPALPPLPGQGQLPPGQ